MPTNPSNPAWPDVPVREPLGPMGLRRYGKYVLVRKLAEGGMAEIFLAKQLAIEGFEKNVVIKRMLPVLTEVPEFVAMFLDEARLAAGLNHPNIVHIADLGFAEGCYYIAMEYLAGEDLAGVLRAARRSGMHLPTEQVLRVIAEAGKGLHFAHEATAPSGAPLGLVHRDVSPSNIFVTYTGQVKMLDFGVAKAASSAGQTAAGVVKGKFHYMSPEHARGEPVDRRCDVFSLGVSLYEALTLARPFARDTELAVLQAVLAGEVTPVSRIRTDLPPAVVEVVTRAMHSQPARRYQTMLELVNDLEAIIGGTSAAQVQAVGGMVAGLFDAARISARTRIVSLAELGPVPPSDPADPTQPAGKVSPGDHTVAVAAPAAVLASRRRRRRTVAAILAGTGLAALAVAAALSGAPRPAPPLDVMAAPAPDLVEPAGALPVPGPSEPGDSAPGTAPSVQPGEGVPGAGAVMVGGDAGGVEDDAGLALPSTPPPRTRPARPVRLDERLIARLTARAHGRFRACFEAHRDELPGSKGQVLLTFDIAGSGQVSAVTTDLPAPKVSRCLEQAVRGVSFPRHQDAAVRARLNLDYDVRRVD